MQCHTISKIFLIGLTFLVSYDFNEKQRYYKRTSNIRFYTPGKNNFNIK